MDLANAHYTSPKSTVEGHGSQTYIIMNPCILKKKKTNIKKKKKKLLFGRETISYNQVLKGTIKKTLNDVFHI
jgi:hypothetical protein